MKVRVLYESPDRLRLRVPLAQMTLEQADALEGYLNTIPGVRKASF